MKKYLSSAAISALLAAPAFAGNLQEPIVEPIIAAPVQVQPISDWTGFYLGGQLGYGRTSSIVRPGMEMSAPVSDGGITPLSTFGPFAPELDFGKLDGGLGGIHAGYLHDFGQMVVGGELDYDWTNMSSKIDVTEGSAKLEVENIARLKALVGYDLGDGLLYGTAGAFRAEMKGTDPWGDTGKAKDNGWLAGAGYKHKFTDNWIGGVEALYHKASDFDGEGFDLKMTTITARISYKF